jgi:hypothetical protein
MATSIKNIVLTYSFTRPSNTTTYAAEDAVNDGTNNITFTPSTDIQDGQSLIVKSVRLTTNSTTTTNGSFRLYLTDTTQTAIADNAQQTLLYTNKAKRVGYVDLSLATGGTGSDCAESYITDVNVPFKSVSTDFYGYLVAKAAYVPASAQEFYIELVCQLIDP